MPGSVFPRLDMKFKWWIAGSRKVSTDQDLGYFNEHVIHIVIELSRKAIHITVRHQNARKERKSSFLETSKPYMLMAATPPVLVDQIVQCRCGFA